jgi:hypothetical protein
MGWGLEGLLHTVVPSRVMHFCAVGRGQGLQEAAVGRGARECDAWSCCGGQQELGCLGCACQAGQPSAQVGTTLLLHHLSCLYPWCRCPCRPRHSANARPWQPDSISLSGGHALPQSLICDSSIYILFFGSTDFLGFGSCLPDAQCSPLRCAWVPEQ